PDDHPVVARLPPPPGFPAVHQLAVVAERVWLEDRTLRPDQVLLLGEGLVVGRDSAATPGANREVGKLTPAHSMSSSPSSTPLAECPFTGWPRSQVPSTLPRTRRPA